MSDAASLATELFGASGTTLLFQDSPYEPAVLSLFADASFHDDQSLRDALTAAGFNELSLTALPQGTYENQNAAFDAWTFGPTGDEAIILAFRGTDDFTSTENFIASFLGSADAADWTNTQAYYDLLAPGVAAVDAYAAANGVNRVYATGFSLGGAATAVYMENHPNSNGVYYDAVTFGSPGVLTPDDIDLTAASSPFSAQYYADVALAAMDPDPRLTAFEIDEDPATYFGAKTGAVTVGFDLDPNASAATFDLAAFLEDSSAAAYHNLGLYELAAVNYGQLLLGQTAVSPATVTVDVSLPGAQTSGVLAFAT
jgi:pimeloyl-ACP methyl ester carboxylesterase